MDWFKNILYSLPLEAISEILSEIAIWWAQLVKDIPPADLPMYAYLGGTLIVLVLWLLVARMMPRPLGGMSWMLLFAVLLAPSNALDDPGTIAPASIAVVYAILMKDFSGAIANMVPIMVVLVVGLFVGFIWQLIRSAFESSLDKARSHTAEDAKATAELTTGNYLAKDESIKGQASQDLHKQPANTQPTDDQLLRKTPESAKPETDTDVKKDSILVKNSDGDKADR